MTLAVILALVWLLLLLLPRPLAVILALAWLLLLLLPRPLALLLPLTLTIILASTLALLLPLTLTLLLASTFAVLLPLTRALLRHSRAHRNQLDRFAIILTSLCILWGAMVPFFTLPCYLVLRCCRFFLRDDDDSAHLCGKDIREVPEVM